MEESTSRTDVYQSYLCMKINSLEVQKLRPTESRHHKRMANFMLEVYRVLENSVSLAFRRV